MSGNERTISLRQAAQRLGEAARPKPKKLDEDALLDYLRSKELVARFRCPGSSAEWVVIPPAYWHSVDPQSFSSMRKSQKGKRTGRFTVELREFVDQFIEALELDKADLVKEIRAIITAGGRVEPVILASEWDEFRQRIQLGTSPLESRGRRQKEAWRELSILIAQHFLKLGVRGARAADASKIAHSVVADAERQSIPGVPKPDTIRPEIGKIIDFARQLQDSQ